MPLPQDNSTQLQLLIDRANNGQQESWGELLELVDGRLHRLTQRMLAHYPRLRRWEQTDDIFQNAAIRLHRSLSEVKPESVKSFFGLASLQIRRTLIELARKYYGPEGHGANHQSDPNADPDGAVGAEQNHRPQHPHEPISLEDWNAFHESVATLPEDVRQVFEMQWYGGLEQQSIADALEISLSTVQRRIYRARFLLGTMLRSDVTKS